MSGAEGGVIVGVFVAVAGAQSDAAVVGLLWRFGVGESADLAPGLRSEAVPPKAALRRVLALASSKNKHGVFVDRRRVSDEFGRARFGFEGAPRAAVGIPHPKVPLLVQPFQSSVQIHAAVEGCC